jgi:hypothetical protein
MSQNEAFEEAAAKIRGSNSTAAACLVCHFSKLERSLFDFVLDFLLEQTLHFSTRTTPNAFRALDSKIAVLMSTRHPTESLSKRLPRVQTKSIAVQH